MFNDKIKIKYLFPKTKSSAISCLCNRSRCNKYMHWFIENVIFQGLGLVLLIFSKFSTITKY